MFYSKLLQASSLTILAALLFVASLFPAKAYSLDSEDTRIFITGFNAYQKKDYKTTVENMSLLLSKYPDSQLKDMAIFWLARANYKAGAKSDAARYMARFFHDYPESPLKCTVEEGLVTLAQGYHPDGANTEPSPAVNAFQGAGPAVGMVQAAGTAMPHSFAPPAAQAPTALSQGKAPVAKAQIENAGIVNPIPERMDSGSRKAAAETDAAEKAAEKVAEKLAKSEAERVAERVAEKVAERVAEKVAERVAEKVAEKIIAERLAADRLAQEKKERVAGQHAKSLELREKAILAYKAVIDRFPGTAASSGAFARLHQLGIEYHSMQ